MFSKSDVLKALQNHIGKTNGVKCDALVSEINHKPWREPSYAAQRQVRKLVTELRLEGHHICAHPASGYFIAETEDELNDTCLFLHQRAMASLTQISRMKKVSLPDLRGQLRLPG